MGRLSIGDVMHKGSRRIVRVSWRGCMGGNGGPVYAAMKGIHNAG